MKKRVLLYSVDPRKHQIAARSQSLLSLLYYSFAPQHKPYDAATFRIQLHPILIVKFDPHIYIQSI